MKNLYFSLLLSLLVLTATAQQQPGQPIQLTVFTVTCNNGEALVKWTTAAETNNDFFTIERTTDGINFDKVGTVKGAGNSVFNINYEFTDPTPLSGTSYYRLTQTSFDGTVNNFDLVPFQA